MKKITVLLLIIVLICCLCGCIDTNSGNIKVAVTIVPQQAFVKAVCGDKVDVITMVPVGYSPETYEPTPIEMQKFNESAVYFAIGVPAEMNILPNASMLTVKLNEIVAQQYDERTINGEGRDPHIWLSPRRAIVMVGEIARVMAEIDSANAEFYNQNAQNYIQQLHRLDQELTQAVEAMSNKKFLVYHPAFGYLADDYGLTMYAIEEEGKEATARSLAEMVDFAKKEGIKAVFYQEEMTNKQAQAFAEEIGGSTVMLSPLSADYITNLKNMISLIKEVSNG